MNAVRRKQISLLLILVLAALLLLLSTGGAAAKNNPRVIPPHANAFGKSYEEWSAEWWQWMFSLPADGNHPMLADGDVDCNYEQGGKVWFLAGAPTQWEVGVNEVVRSCTEPIPHGKALFLPVVNIVCNTYDGDDISFGSLENCANFVTDNFVVPISAQVDGREVRNLEAYRIISPEFDFSTVDPPLWYPPNDVYQGVSGGYYLLLPPMSKGEHNISFEGAIVVPPGVDWTTKVHYNFFVGK